MKKITLAIALLSASVSSFAASSTWTLDIWNSTGCSLIVSGQTPIAATDIYEHTYTINYGTTVKIFQTEKIDGTCNDTQYKNTPQSTAIATIQRPEQGNGSIAEEYPVGDITPYLTGNSDDDQKMPPFTLNFGDHSPVSIPATVNSLDIVLNKF